MEQIITKAECTEQKPLIQELLIFYRYIILLYRKIAQRASHDHPYHGPHWHTSAGAASPVQPPSARRRRQRRRAGCMWAACRRQIAPRGM